MCTISTEAKIKNFWVFFSSLRKPRFGAIPFLKKFQNNIDFSLWGQHSAAFLKNALFSNFTSTYWRKKMIFFSELLLWDLDESSCSTQSSSGVFQQCFSGVRQMPRPLHDTKAQFYRFQYNEPIFCCKEIAASIW